MGPKLGTYCCILAEPAAYVCWEEALLQDRDQGAVCTGLTVILLQMCQGGALEEENDRLQEQVSELQEEVCRLDMSPLRGAWSPEAASARDVQAFTQAGCLLELSDNARLVLAAYDVRTKPPCRHPCAPDC